MFKKLVRLVAIAALGCIFSVSISAAIFFATRAVRPVFDFLAQYYPYVIVAFLIAYAIAYLRYRRKKAAQRERRLQSQRDIEAIRERVRDSVRFSKKSYSDIDSGRASRVASEGTDSAKDSSNIRYRDYDARASLEPLEVESAWKGLARVFLEAMLLLVICIAVITPLISIVLYVFFGVPAKIVTVSSTISCFIISLSATFLCKNWFNSVGEKASFVIAATCLSPTVIPLFPQLNYFTLW